MFEHQECTSLKSTALDFQMRNASRNLTRFMVDHAHQIRKITGFGYVESDVAPSSFLALKTAHAVAKMHNAALPVYAGASSDTIYTSTEGNWAFRFWHDMVHVQNDLAFTLADEVAVADIQGQVVAEFFGDDSLEYRMFMADTAGQSVYAAMHGGEFPKDQWSFVRTMVQA